MKTIKACLVALSATFVLLSPLSSRAVPVNQQICASLGGTTTSVANTDGNTTTYDVKWVGFDPNPLMETTVKTKAGCLVAQLSVHAGHVSTPGFNYGDVLAAYQVTVDNVPMIGHTSGCWNVPSQQWFNCILFNNDLDNGGTGKQDMAFIGGHSYHLYRWVEAGYHRVQVKYAGCCNGNLSNPPNSSGAYSGANLLTLHYLAP
jgi:hypothetical protein